MAINWPVLFIIALSLGTGWVIGIRRGYRIGWRHAVDTMKKVAKALQEEKK